jgi:very-short-patch-repair endonuclease
MLRGLLERGLPRPETNVKLNLDGTCVEIDLLWAEQRLAVETDGEETHGTPPAFQRDRWRDQVLLANGYRVSRVTWDQMDAEPEAVFSRVRRMLGAG